MKISIITVFPELHTQFIQASLIGRAVDKGLIEINLIRMSDLCEPKERIDEPTVGPGAGMIIKPAVIEKAIIACEQKYGVGIKIFFSPQGRPLNQHVLTAFAQKLTSDTSAMPTGQNQPTGIKHIILICSRYEGIDARVEKLYADYLISVGDYVIMGGDLPAQIFLEGLLRLLPGIVGSQESVQQDSFQTSFFDYPQYGLPVSWHNQKIPEVLRSGNHAEIAQWRKQEACKNTIAHRFDWFVQNQPSQEDRALARIYIPPHYVALMHTDVNLKGGTVGNTSVASLDIHDTARACTTYGIKTFFIVTPLLDQQEIIKTFLGFWGSDQGKKYNESRSKAVSSVKLVSTFDDLVAAIETEEGITPLIITTSARQSSLNQVIDYNSQAHVWNHKKPILFVFGTGQGLSDKILSKSNYHLLPIQGLTTYNHLSVRSAVSIVLDRWLGLHPKLKIEL
jgi:tRNA (guanine37-N1)-methyltransferase